MDARGKEVGEMVKKVKVNKRYTFTVIKLVSPGDKSMYRTGTTVNNIITLVSDAYYTYVDHFEYINVE